MQSACAVRRVRIVCAMWLCSLQNACAACNVRARWLCIGLCHVPVQCAVCLCSLTCACALCGVLVCNVPVQCDQGQYKRYRMFAHSCYKQDYRQILVVVCLLPCVAYACAVVVRWACVACGVLVQYAVCLCSFALCLCSLHCGCTVCNVLVQFAVCLCSLPCACAVCGLFICSTKLWGQARTV